jgi:DNA (cytosine-5)-methyltransferase 1
VTAYYNEIDEYAAQWLRNLIAAGHIAPGDVDTRSITEVHPDDIKNYTQCHFFAGIGVWSHALRRAGWSDSRPVWTGSCPCQPFSTAGKGAGFDDERHLWPVFGNLIRERRPATVFGEQVASKDADAWIDLVQADLETMGYAVGAIPFPAAGVGAPHIRDRLYWVADSSSTGLVPSPHTGVHRGEKGARARDGEPERHSDFGWLGHTDDEGLERHTGDGGAAGRGGEAGSTAEASVFGWLADPDSEQRPHGEPRSGDAHAAGGREQSAATATGLCSDSRPSPLNGFWRDADWLLCRDGKWRPVEPGTFPLAHGITNRVGRLRAYGNAICAEAAVEFIKVAMEYRP